MKLRSKFTIWSGISLIFIAAIGIVAWFAIQQMLISADSIEHTHQMIQHSLQLKNNIYKMEANEKYFLLLTEESHFLQEYTDIKVKIEKEFSFLLEEVITPTQRDLLKTIKVKVNNWDKTVAVVEINSSKEKARKSSKLNAALILKKKQLDLRQSKSSTVNEEKLQETGNNPPLNPLHGGEQSLQFVSEKTGEIANNPPINPLPGGEQKGWAIPPSKEKEHLESTVILQTIADKPSIEHPPSPRLRRTGQASSFAKASADRSSIEYKELQNDLKVYGERVIRQDVLLSEAITGINRFIENEKTLMFKRKGTTLTLIYRISFIIICMIILFLIIYTIISYFLSRSILNPLRATTEMMKDISEGKADLTKRLHAKSNDELVELVSWFNKFIGKLHKIIKHMQEENIRVKSSSSELSATATGLANVAVETSSKADELFLVAEDVAQTMDYTKEKSSQYTTDSGEMLNFIQSDFLHNVSYETDQIVSIKKNIGYTSTNLIEMNKQVLGMKVIIDSIKDLASQSKILSVNASIQATKAGDYGKGFDVVAKQIKELANKSETSVKMFLKSIKGILEISNIAGLSVEKSSNFINKSISNSENLQQILVKHTDNISELVEGMNELSSIYNKQHDDTAVLLNTAKSIKLSTGTNAEGAKKLQTAADNLKEFSVRLNSLIDDFKI